MLPWEISSWQPMVGMTWFLDINKCKIQTTMEKVVNYKQISLRVCSIGMTQSQSQVWAESTIKILLKRTATYYYRQGKPSKDQRGHWQCHLGGRRNLGWFLRPHLLPCQTPGQAGEGKIWSNQWHRPIFKSISGRVSADCGSSWLWGATCCTQGFWVQWLPHSQKSKTTGISFYAVQDN